MLARENWLIVGRKLMQLVYSLSPVLSDLEVDQFLSASFRIRRTIPSITEEHS